MDSSRESFEKGLLKVHCKGDRVFAGLSYLLLSKCKNIQEGKPFWKDKKVWQIRRVLGGCWSEVEHFLVFMDKEMGQAIKDNRIFILPGPNMDGKGGYIDIQMKGSKEELDEWLKIRLKDKMSMKLMKRALEFEVVRGDNAF